MSQNSDLHFIVRHVLNERKRSKQKQKAEFFHLCENLSDEVVYLISDQDYKIKLD